VADNRASALRYLTRKGLTPAQAAGVVGSLMQESGLRTKAKNPSSGALGIGQWLGGRKTNLLNSGKSGDLQGQLDFLWSELQGPERAALTRLRGAHTVPDAASAFTWGFERPGRAEANMPNRIRQGRAALGLAGDLHADPDDAEPPPVQRYRTTTTSTPGVDNRQARAQLITSFLGTKNYDPLDFAMQARGLRDVAPTSETTRTRIPGAAPQHSATPSAPSSGGHISPRARRGDPVVSSRQSVGGQHETAGLPGYPARDYFAPAGTHAVAPVSGTVIRLSGHDPKDGPTNGPHGPLGFSVYIRGSDGKTYFLTHMGSRTVRAGQKIRQGQVIGTVADYDKYGTASHIHQGVSG
jgi:murein DD-endopeptidase MepM/ murein hydrolase activator NlpD